MEKLKYVLTEAASTLLLLIAGSKTGGLPKGTVSDRAILARLLVTTS